MCFEGADSSFGGVASVGMWWNKLVCCVPFGFDSVFVGGAGFIVEYLEVDMVLVVVDESHNVVVSCDAVDVAS